MPKRHRFTTDRVRRTFSPPPEGATTSSGKPITQAFYWDEQTEGFGLVVSESNRSFIVQRWVDGKTRRVTLGRVGGAWKNRHVPADWRTDDVCSLKAAREAARKVYNHLGDDEPITATAVEPAPLPTPTLREAIDFHAENMRHKECEEDNIENVAYTLGLHVGDWIDLPLGDITKEMCDERHKAITADGKPTTANNVFDRLRAVWNTIAQKRNGIPENPARSITRNKPGKSVTALPWDELPAWADRTNKIKNPIRRDLWWFILFTGLRSTDACTVRWEHLNLTDKTIKKDFGHGEVVIEPGCIHRPKPKGGVDKAFTVPLCKLALSILRRRKADNQRDFGGHDRGWVWPANSRKGHVFPKGLKESEYWRDDEGKQRKRGVSVHPHKLRHTFKTAGYEAGVPKLDLDILTNHTKPSSNDVGERYITPSVEHLRKQVDLAADFLLAKTGRTPVESIRRYPRVAQSDRASDS